MPVKNIKRRTNDGLQGTIVGLTKEEKQALIKDGASVSPCLNLTDLTTDPPTVRTTITEEEKTNLENGLYNSVLYSDPSLGESGLYSMYFPEPLVSMNGLFIFSTYSVSVDASMGAFVVTGSSVHQMTIGDKNANGTYAIDISKAIDTTFGGGGGGASVSPILNLMDLETQSVRTSITEEEKTNFENGLYSQVFYLDASLGENAFIAVYFPEWCSIVFEQGFATYAGTFDSDTGIITLTHLNIYKIYFEDKSADGTYPITIDKASELQLGGGSSTPSTSIPFQDITVSELANHVGEIGNFHITDLKATVTLLGETECNGVWFSGSVSTASNLCGELWVKYVDVTPNQYIFLGSGLYQILGGKIKNGLCSLGGMFNPVEVGTIKTIGGYQTFNSSIGSKMLSTLLEDGRFVFVGKVNKVDSNTSRTVVTLSMPTAFNQSATGEETYCELAGLFDGSGIGSMAMKKNSDGNPEFKSFTTWLPPVTSTSEGKALIVTGGNAQWSDIPTGGEIEVIEGTITSTQGNQNEFTISVVPKGKIFILKMFLGNILMSMADSTTYTGFCFVGNSCFGTMLDVSTKSGSIIAIDTAYWMNADSTQNGRVLSIIDGAPSWSDPPRYEHTVTIKNSAGKILWTQTMRNSSNTVVNSYTNLKTLFGEATYAGFGEYCQLNLHGGTAETDKLIKADGTEVTLASLGAIVYTDDCFLSK